MAFRQLEGISRWVTVPQVERDAVMAPMGSSSSPGSWIDIEVKYGEFPTILSKSGTTSSPGER
jgi:hypothetical protein